MPSFVSRDLPEGGRGRVRTSRLLSPRGCPGLGVRPGQACGTRPCLWDLARLWDPAPPVGPGGACGARRGLWDPARLWDPALPVGPSGACGTRPVRSGRPVGPGPACGTRPGLDTQPSAHMPSPRGASEPRRDPGLAERGPCA